MSVHPVKRILIKISGESFAGTPRSYNPSFYADTVCPEKPLLEKSTLLRLANDIAQLSLSGFQMCIVVGGGNIVRGAELTQSFQIDRPVADMMGMLATLINALALQQCIENCGVVARVQSALEIEKAAEPYIRRRAIRHLEKGRVVIFAAGTGDSHFTTDTAAALRALEVNCDLLVKATNVDGVYSADPKRNNDAIFYETLSYDDAVQQKLKVMDATAFALLRDYHLPLIVCSIERTHEIIDMIQGRGLCTRIY